MRLALEGLGAFAKGQPRALLWAGVAPTPPLLQLKEAVDAALSRAIGLKPERRYIPHLSLARYKSKGYEGRDEEVLEAAKELEKGIDFGFEATELKLYRSDLNPVAPSISVLSAWPLEGDGS